MSTDLNFFIFLEVKIKVGYLFGVQHKWINRTSMVLLPLFLDWRTANSLSF